MAAAGREFSLTPLIRQHLLPASRLQGDGWFTSIAHWSRRRNVSQKTFSELFLPRYCTEVHLPHIFLGQESAAHVSPEPLLIFDFRIIFRVDGRTNMFEFDFQKFETLKSFVLPQNIRFRWGLMRDIDRRLRNNSKPSTKSIPPPQTPSFSYRVT